MRYMLLALLIVLTSCSSQLEQPTVECTPAWTLYEDSCVYIECHRGVVDSRYGFESEQACEAFIEDQ